MGMATRDAYGQALAELVKENDHIVVLDADLAGSTKSGNAKKAAPERFFDMGIAEADMIGTAAGFAASGYIPFASSFAIFAAGRAWEQIRNSCAYPNLNVKIAGSHAGITVGEDGATHQALEDIAVMRVLPNMHVIVPCDAAETKAAVRYMAKTDGPFYLRTGRASVDDVYSEGNVPDITKVHLLREGRDLIIFACGVMVPNALKAAELLKACNVDAAVADVCMLKPADNAGITALLEKYNNVVTCEEHNVIGGLGSLIAEISADSTPRRILRIGMQDVFGESGTPASLLEKYKLDPKGICEQILDCIRS